MAVLSVVSFVLGLVAIDMHCDHWSLYGTYPAKKHLEACSAYYSNMNDQPVYIQAIIPVAVVIGVIALVGRLLSSKRNIYDILTVPTFLASVLLFVLGVLPQRERVSTVITPNYTEFAQHVQLHYIAKYHVYIAGSLVLTYILQTLSNTKRAATAGKLKSN